MDNERKEALASRLAHRPMLFMLVRALLFSAWFRVFFVLALLTPLVFVGFVFRFWRTTPTGFKPIVRVSGLDLVQAWSLKRSAVRLVQEGQTEAGLRAWVSAIANNAADTDALRGFLRDVNRHIDPPKFQSEALSDAVWLLRVGQTNLIDLEVAGETFVKYGVNSYALGLLELRPHELTPALQRLYLKALFNEARMTEFGAHLKLIGGSEALRADPELSLYLAAYDAGWSSTDAAAEGRKRLESLLEDTAHRVLASRLYLRVLAQLGETERYFEVLDRLQSWQRDIVADHVQGWRLLADHNQRERAARLAGDFPSRPMSALETLLLAQACYELGLRDKAIQTLDKFTVEFGFFDELWITYANVLIQAQDWDRLRQLAITIRANPDVNLRLRALSFYIEARAELGDNHRAAADDAVAKILTVPIDNVGLAFALARSLHRLQYVQEARALLLAQEARAETRVEYWQLLGRIAFETKDAALLLRATGQAYKLAPADRGIAQNYGAALLVQRERPEEAVRIFFELLRTAPGNPEFRLNYAAALIQNARVAEAAGELDRLKDAPLGDAARTSFNYARCELLLQQGRLAEAQQLRARLKPEFLFPGELEFLDRRFKEKSAQ